MVASSNPPPDLTESPAYKRLSLRPPTECMCPCCLSDHPDNRSAKAYGAEAWHKYQEILKELPGLSAEQFVKGLHPEWRVLLGKFKDRDRKHFLRDLTWLPPEKS